MTDTARITYRVSDEEWARTSALRWNPDVFPTYYCFHGLVSFWTGGDEILGTDHFDISVADLAVGLAEVVGELRTDAVGTFKFRQGDDMLEMTFQAGVNVVTIFHNLAPGRSWSCDRRALEKAMIEFIATFTDEAARRVPDLFGWRDLETLRYFSTEHI